MGGGRSHTCLFPQAEKNIHQKAAFSWSLPGDLSPSQSRIVAFARQALILKLQMERLHRFMPIRCLCPRRAKATANFVQKGRRGGMLSCCIAPAGLACDLVPGILPSFSLSPSAQQPGTFRAQLTPPAHGACSAHLTHFSYLLPKRKTFSYKNKTFWLSFCNFFKATQLSSSDLVCFGLCVSIQFWVTKLQTSQACETSILLHHLCLPG